MIISMKLGSIAQGDVVFVQVSHGVLVKKT